MSILCFDADSREVFYINLVEFGIPMKLVKSIKIFLAETYSRDRLGKNLSDMFPLRNALKQGDALTPFLFNFVLENAIRSVWLNLDDLKVNCTHQIMVYVYYGKILGGSVHTIKNRIFSIC